MRLNKTTYVALTSILISVQSTSVYAEEAKKGFFGKEKMKDVWDSIDKEKLIDSSTEKFVQFSDTIVDLTPRLKTMGYEIEVVRMQMLPPKGILRLTSVLDPQAEIVRAAIADDEAILKKAILVTAEKAKIIQKALTLEQVILDVEIDVNPSVRVSYRNKKDGEAENSAIFSDIDLLCGQSL